MDTKDLIAIQRFCSHYEIPLSFIEELKDYELIEITIIENTNYIKKTQINDLERLIRLHFDLEINFEGLDVVDNLLKRVNALQNEITTLNNKLRRYEDL